MIEWHYCAGHKAMMKAKVIQTLLNSIPMPDIEIIFTVSDRFSMFTNKVFGAWSA